MKSKLIFFKSSNEIEHCVLLTTPFAMYQPKVFSISDLSLQTYNFEKFYLKLWH